MTKCCRDSNSQPSRETRLGPCRLLLQEPAGSPKINFVVQRSNFWKCSTKRNACSRQHANLIGFSYVTCNSARTWREPSHRFSSNLNPCVDHSPLSTDHGISIMTQDILRIRFCRIRFWILISNYANAEKILWSSHNALLSMGYFVHVGHVGCYLLWCQYKPLFSK